MNPPSPLRNRFLPSLSSRLPHPLFKVFQKNIANAAVKSIETSAKKKNSPNGITVGASYRLLSPGDPDEKRNFFKPRYDGADPGAYLFLIQSSFYNFPFTIFQRLVTTVSK